MSDGKHIEKTRIWKGKSEEGGNRKLGFHLINLLAAEENVFGFKFLGFLVFHFFRFFYFKFKSYISQSFCLVIGPSQQH